MTMNNREKSNLELEKKTFLINQKLKYIALASSLINLI